MLSLKSFAVCLLVTAATGCATDFVAPTARNLEGTWRRQPEAMNVAHYLVIARGGQYETRYEWSGQPGLPSDSVVASESQFGHFTLAGPYLTMVEDSASGWSEQGSWSRVGTPFYIEGPPSPSFVHLTDTELELRFSVNAGAGYVPVTATFRRDR